jgi:TetR/AcrR family fatty acid metabolism transcriptional regulator
VRTKTPEQADKMLDAATRLFSRRRFHEVRMEDIAAEAEVGKGTLYRYFADKEELYVALLTRASRQFRELMLAEVGRARTPRGRLRAVVAAIITFFDDQPHVTPLIQRAEVTHGRDSPWQPIRDILLAQVLAILEEARAAGEFTVADPETAALMLLGGLRSVLLFGRRPRPTRLPEQIVAGWLGGVAEPAAEPVGVAE